MELTDPNLVLDAMKNLKLIREKLMMGQSDQKSYFDVRKRNLEFNVEDWFI